MQQLFAVPTYVSRTFLSLCFVLLALTPYTRAQILRLDDTTSPPIPGAGMTT